MYTYTKHINAEEDQTKVIHYLRSSLVYQNFHVFFYSFFDKHTENIIDREKGGKKGKAKARQCTPRVYKGNQAKRTKKGWQTKEKHHLPTTT